jgi:hypothetical protein
LGHRIARFSVCSFHGRGRIAGERPKYALRFDLTNYDAAPTACPWDVESQEPLAPNRWPTGGELARVFNPDWNATALYMPMDRVALEGHDVWLSAPAAYLWQAGGEGIAQYLRVISDLLRSEQYSGVRSG